MTAQLSLGAGGKAVNTVASGDHSRKQSLAFFLSCSPHQAAFGLEESSSHRYNTLDSRSIMVRLLPVISLKKKKKRKFLPACSPSQHSRLFFNFTSPKLKEKELRNFKSR